MEEGMQAGMFGKDAAGKCFQGKLLDEPVVDFMAQDA